MNETRENTTMQRVAELMAEHDWQQQARNTVAEEVLVYLNPENCREMALGVADVLQNADMDGWTTDAVARTGQAISTLLRVADMQEQAEIDARLKRRHQEKDAEAGSVNGDENPIALSDELLTVSRETLHDLQDSLVTPIGLLNQVRMAQRMSGDDESQIDSNSTALALQEAVDLMDDARRLLKTHLDDVTGIKPVH